jgi:hypothetical protein
MFMATRKYNHQTRQCAKCSKIQQLACRLNTYSYYRHLLFTAVHMMSL